MTKRMFWLGFGGVAIACGGAARGTDPDQSTSGGSATTGSTGGVNPGGSSARGGSDTTPSVSGTGNQATGAVAGNSGATSGGMSGTPRNEAGAAGAGAPGTGGDGGSGGSSGSGPHTKDPISVCGSNTLAGGIYCSKDAFCEALECGKPWSLFDADGCARKLCSSDDACATGSRCVPAPVAGKFDATCFAEYDSCEDSSGTCECSPYPECGGRALCLSEQEFPPESDCPVESFSCAELSRVAANLKAYADEEDFFLMGETSSTVNGRVEACRAKVDGLLASCD